LILWSLKFHTLSKSSSPVHVLARMAEVSLPKQCLIPEPGFLQAAYRLLPYCPELAGSKEVSLELAILSC